MTRNSSGALRRSMRWLPVLALVALSLGVLVSGAPHLFSLDRLLSYRAALMEAVAEDRLRSIGIACLVYIGCVIVSVPASLVLTILSGFLFGTTTGAGIALVSATTGAAIVFSIGRGPMSEFLVTRAGPRLGRLAAGFRDDAFGYILVLRLLPIFPFWMTNLAPAAFGVSLRTFVLATFLGLTPGALRLRGGRSGDRGRHRGQRSRQGGVPGERRRRVRRGPVPAVAGHRQDSRGPRRDRRFRASLHRAETPLRPADARVRPSPSRQIPIAGVLDGAAPEA